MYSHYNVYPRKIVVTCEIKQGTQRYLSSLLDRSWELDSEHLSQEALAEIISALTHLGYHIEVATTHEQLLKLKQTRTELLCVNLSVGYGGASTKVYTAALLEILGIPYVGSPPHSLAITRDKAVAKAVAKCAGIPTPLWQVMLPDTPIAAELEMPVIVKPLHESCSIGINASSIIHNHWDLSAAVSRIWTIYQQAAIVEQYVQGVDVEVPFIGNKDVLGFVAVIPRLAQQGCDILTAGAVYRDAYDFASPTECVVWSPQAEDRIRSWVREFANATSMRDYGRLDFRIRPSGEIFFIEASTHPYLAVHSSFSWLYRRAGREYNDLWHDLLTTCMRRYRMEGTSLGSERVSSG